MKFVAGFPNCSQRGDYLLYGFPKNMGAWWLPDGEQIIVVAAMKPEGYSVLKYDVKEKVVKEVLMDVFERDGTFRLLSISGSKAKLLHIKYGDYKSINLELLDLCITSSG